MRSLFSRFKIPIGMTAQAQPPPPVSRASNGTVFSLFMALALLTSLFVGAQTAMATDPTDTECVLAGSYFEIDCDANLKVDDGNVFDFCTDDNINKCLDWPNVNFPPPSLTF